MAKPTKQINEAEFRAVIKQLIKEQYNKKVQINEEKSDDAILLGSPKNPITPPKGKELDVNMSAMDKTDGKISEPIVSVSASSQSKDGAFSKGGKKADFETKEGMNDADNKMKGSDKGTVHFDVNMAAEDKNIDDVGTKTFVQPGTETKTGQHKPVYSEKAKNEKDEDPIAVGIQLPEGFMSKSMKKSELYNFIISEGKRIAKL